MTLLILFLKSFYTSLSLIGAYAGMHIGYNGAKEDDSTQAQCIVLGFVGMLAGYFIATCIFALCILPFVIMWVVWGLL